MQEAVPSALAAWETFYVIVGSSAAALTGLQFVVMVLGSEVRALSVSTTRAFRHSDDRPLLRRPVCLDDPDRTVARARNPALALGACGIVGVMYVVMVARHARRQTDYVPVFEDWLWHGVLPIIA